MKIVKPFAVIMQPAADGACTDSSKEFTLQDGLASLRRTEWIARISHRSEEAQTEDSWRRLLSDVVLKHGDWSVAEHVGITVDMYIDRGVQQELTRHRLAAYTIESTRFVNYTKKLGASFIYPTRSGETCEYCDDGHEVEWNAHEEDMRLGGRWEHLKTGTKCAYNPDWLRAIHNAETEYQELITAGWRPQEARSVFPLSLGSRVIATMNLRTWRHVFLMRTTAEAHPSFKQVTLPLLQKFKQFIPLFYDDIEPGARQVDNLKKGR